MWFFLVFCVDKTNWVSSLLILLIIYMLYISLCVCVCIQVVFFGLISVTNKSLQSEIPYVSFSLL